LLLRARESASCCPSAPAGSHPIGCCVVHDEEHRMEATDETIQLVERVAALVSAKPV
jgi:hypothetical protein